MKKYDEYMARLAETLPAELTTLEQIRELPWAGNAMCDCPIMAYVDRVFSLNENLPRELRKEGAALANHLMTGEDCTFYSEEEFDEYLTYAREAQSRLH